MSFSDCIKKAFDDKKIREDHLREAEAVYNRYREHFIRSGSLENDADQLAGQKAAEHIKAEVEVSKLRRARTIQAQKKINFELDNYRDRKGNPNYLAAAEALIERDEYKKGNYDVLSRAKVIHGRAHGIISNFIEKYQPQYAGLVSPKIGMDNVARELFGGNTGDAAAKEYAKSITEALEYLRKRANRSGANIAKREVYGLPQTHNYTEIFKTNKDDWVNFVYDKLNWEKMFDPRDGLPIAETKRREVLGYVYSTIKSQGYHKIRADAIKQNTGSFAGRFEKHRFLEFKDADNWLEYNKKFGGGDAFEVVNQHIEYMSKNIAMLEIFGPNPSSMREHIKNRVRNDAAKIDLSATSETFSGRPKVQDINSRLNRFDDMFNYIQSGGGSGGGGPIARVFMGVRQLITSAFLGGASIVAIPSDLMLSGITARHLGLPPMKILKNYIRLLNPGSRADKAAAVQAGLIAESATSLAFGQNRYIGDIVSPKVTRKITDVSLRASLLTPHTQAAKHAWGLSVMGAMADMVGKDFSSLGKFKNIMERYGISADEWDILRKTDLHEYEGGRLLRPDDMFVRSDVDATTAEAISDKFMSLILSESEFAVPSFSLKARVATISNSRPGTIIGELVRSYAMFKHFATALFFTQIQRMMAQPTFSSKARYGAAFASALTISAALAIQARAIASGKDPKDMNPANTNGQKFWVESMLKGGGLGILGDFLFSGLNRFGGGLAQTAAGPVVQLLNDVRELTLGNAKQLIEGKDTKFLPELKRFLQRYNPIQPWYLKTAMDRIWWDTLDEMVDPDAEKNFIKQKNKLQNETGQEYWWEPGSMLPNRAPDLEKAFQETQ